MNVYLLLIAGSEAMLLTAVGIILFALAYQRKQVKQQKEKQHLELIHQRELNEGNIKVTEAERFRIASDLHDEIGHALLTIRMQIAPFSESATSKKLIDETLAKLRRIAYDLYPPGLDLFGIVHALNDLFDQVDLSSDIQIERSFEEGTFQLTRDAELALYRIVQELLSNTVRYGNAETISFRMSASGEDVISTYSDNGCGFVKEKKSAGLGMLNIENRALSAGGHFHFQTAPGTGFCAEIILPNDK